MRIHMGDIGTLCSLATSNEDARRRHVNDEDLVMDNFNPFRQDADTKIASSKAFRQLMFKTQVVSSPVNCLIRNRLSHSMEVESIATMIADILGLNVDFVRAIARGHDMGHVPFGHAGEAFLSERLGKKFRHEVFGVVRAQKIERLGQGLNLTWQVLSGIIYHSRGAGEMTITSHMSPEATVVMYADKISYILSDYNDIVNRHLLPAEEALEQTMLIEALGQYQRERANTLILALCRESVSAGRVCFEKSPEAIIFKQLKEKMYDLYEQVNAEGSEDVMARVYDYAEKKILGVNPALLIALMNDQDILFLSGKTIFDRSDFNQTSVAEQLPYVRKLDPSLDLTDPDLDW